MEIQENENEIIVKITKKHDYDILLYNPDFFNLFNLKVDIEIEVENSIQQTGGGFFDDKEVERDELMEKKEMMKLSIPYRYFIYLLKGNLFNLNIFKRFSNLINKKEETTEPELQEKPKLESQPEQKDDGYFSSFKFSNKYPPVEQQEELQEKGEIISSNPMAFDNKLEQSNGENIIEEKKKEQDKNRTKIKSFLPSEGHTETENIPDFVEDKREPEPQPIFVEKNTLPEPRPIEEPESVIFTDNVTKTIILKIKKTDPTMSIVTLDSLMVSMENNENIKTIEQLQNNGLSYIILERIVKDLYIQFRFNKIHGIFINNFNLQNIYCINNHYLILGNENLEQITESDYLEKEKELCKSFVNFIDNLIGVDKDLIHSIIGNTEIGKFKNRMEKKEKMLF